METENQNQNQENQEVEEPVNTNEPKQISQAIMVMLFLLVINEVLLWILGKMKNRSRLLKPLQPTTVTTTLGIGAGLLLNLFTRIFDLHIIEEIQSSFANFFLIVLLPPILYESAINMEIKSFFKNFGSILMFSMLGTTIASFVTSLLVYLISIMGMSDFSLNTCFAFGSLISATDPVAVLSIFRAVNADKIIYTLIFGESTLNDAVAMILYDTSYEMQGSLHTSFVSVAWEATQHFSVVFFGSMFIGIMIGIISAYLLKDERSSLNTEITILIAVPWTSYLIASMFKLSGILSIMSCGISMAKYALPNITSTGLRHPINKATKFSMWFSGFRGAMAYALALQSTEQFKNNNEGTIMLTITLIYSIINIYFNASLLEYMINKLDIKEKPGQQNINSNIQRYDGFWNHIREIFEIFDDNCLQRVLITNQQELSNRQNEQSTFHNDDDDQHVQEHTNNMQNGSPHDLSQEHRVMNQESHQGEDEQFQSQNSITPNIKQRDSLLTRQQKKQKQQQDCLTQSQDMSPSKSNRSQRPKRRQSRKITSSRNSKEQIENQEYKDILHTDDQHSPGQQFQVSDSRKIFQNNNNNDNDSLDSPQNIITDRLKHDQNINKQGDSQDQEQMEEFQKIKNNNN